MCERQVGSEGLCNCRHSAAGVCTQMLSGLAQIAATLHGRSCRPAELPGSCKSPALFLAVVTFTHPILVDVSRSPVLLIRPRLRLGCLPESRGNLDAGVGKGMHMCVREQTSCPRFVACSVSLLLVHVLSSRFAPGLKCHLKMHLWRHSAICCSHLTLF